MSAPYLEPAISISSSGHTDGLGRRELCFDRETGAMLERLHVRPELAAFEAAIRDRVERLSMFEDPRFARTYAAERSASGDLTVVSEFVSGIRLADLLDTSLEETLVPGVDAALGYLTESLSALGTLHQVAGFPHGLIAADRTVFTAEGRLLFLDAAYAAVVDRLGLSRRRLWTEFGIAAAPGTGPARLDAASDLSQAALTAVMLILGRRLDDADYPENVPALLMEVVEVAQIRGSSAFAGGLQRVLQRLLPLPGRRPYETAEEAVADLRQLLRREMGADVCQKALLDFIQQLHPAQSLPLSDDETLEQESAEDFLEEPDEDEHEAFGQESIVEFELDLDGHVERREDRPTDDDVYELSSEDLSEGFGSFVAPGRVGPVSFVPSTPVVEESVPTTEAAPEVREIEIEAQYEPDATQDTEAGAPAASAAPIATPDAVALPEAPAIENAAVDPEPQGDAEIPAAPMVEDPEQVAPPPMDSAPSELDEPVPDQAPAAEWSATDAWTPEPAAPILIEDSFEAASTPTIEDAPPPVEAAVTVAEAPSIETAATASEPAPAPQVSEAVEEVGNDSAASLSASSKSENRRRKRHQQKSARARKDKLRSTASKSETITAQTPPVAAAAPVAATAPVQPAPAPSKSGWLVPPDKTAKFETSTPELIPAFQPAMVQPPPFANAPTPPFAAAPQPIVSYPPPMAPPPAAPAFPTLAPPSAQMPRFGAAAAPRASAPAPAPAAPAPAATMESVTRLSTVRVKAEPPAGYVPTPKAKRVRRGADEALEPVMALPGTFRSPTFAQETSQRGFPWKLTVTVVVLVAAAILAGRAYLPGGALAKTPVEAAPATLPPAEPEAGSTAPPPTGTGQILIKTEPGGASVLLDGKAAGESPVTLNGVAPGRHVLTFLSSSGSVKRTVKVVAGRSVSVEVPIYSGWVSVIAPFVVEIAENGTSIGSTEDGRVMLAPGQHHLVLTNADLGYRAEQDVTVTAGETNSVRLEPTGHANINAIPWAEVWSDGRKIGDTPIANYALPLGGREFLFKHPQFGERKVSATIRAGQPVAVAVDFTKPQQP